MRSHFRTLWSRGLMDKALASGAGDCGFESHRDRVFLVLFFSRVCSASRSCTITGRYALRIARRIQTLHLQGCFASTETRKQPPIRAYLQATDEFSPRSTTASFFLFERHRGVRNPTYYSLNCKIVTKLNLDIPRGERYMRGLERRETR